MIVELKDGKKMEFEPATIMEIAAKINGKLKKTAIIAKVNGVLTELGATLDRDCTLEILTFEDAEGKYALRHTASHILAQAVKRILPEAKLAIGPAIEDGFYYDFDVEESFTPELLEQIEAEMKKIVSENLPLERFALSKAQALEMFAAEPYKIELIEELPEGEEITCYKQGEFTDLCAGPHAMSTGKVKALKLQSAAGAYWRGNEKNKMLKRIYGTAFEKQLELDAHLKSIKEALERDHNKLGRELRYFTTAPEVGQGLPLIMPKGAKAMQILQRFVEDEEERRGYEFTKTPLMAKKDLYMISGHWQHYKEGMFVLGDEEKDEEVMALRPMTCPFQYMIYKAEHHSYRDLPVRFSETSTLFRNEASGEMHGLIRVRQFTLSDAHIMCTPEQLETEFGGVLDLIYYMMKCLGIQNDVSFRFSKYDPNNKEKYIDDPQAWESTQSTMKTILDHIGLDYSEAEDEAAFYGPKLDVQFKNVFGKEDTLFTIQIDFALAEKFGMYYVDADNQKKFPYIIHRSSIGCYERTLAMVIEKYAGALPLWMAPEQVRLLTVTDEAKQYAEKYAQEMKNLGLRVHLDDRMEKIGYKIREARVERIPYILVIGAKESADDTFAVRKRGEGEIGSMDAKEFIDMVLQQADEKVIF